MTTPIVTERGRLTALRAAALFDGTRSALVRDPLIVIDGDTITAVGSGVPAPEHADVTDLGGVMLLPGLVDAHVHLAFDASPDPVGQLAGRSDDETIDAMIRAGQTALRGGVTTVRDLGDRGYLSLRLRGRPGLPAIVAAGSPITTPGGHCHYLGGVAEPTVAGVRAAVREHAEHGVDIIKIMASGGNLTPGTRQELAQFPPEVLRAAVDEAHRHGLKVTAHAHAAGAIADAVAAGADGLEHVSFWTADGVDAPAELIQLIADRRTVAGLTVGVLPVPGLSPFPQVRERMPAILANIARMHEAGALIVASSDAGVAPLKPHDAVRYAPAILRDVGFSPAEALRASPRSRPPCSASATARAGSPPASTPTSSPSTATPSATRPPCTASAPSTPAAPPYPLPGPRTPDRLTPDRLTPGRRTPDVSPRPRITPARTARSLNGVMVPVPTRATAASDVTGISGPANLATIRAAVIAAIKDAGYLHIPEGRRDHTTPAETLRLHGLD